MFPRKSILPFSPTPFSSPDMSACARPPSKPSFGSFSGKKRKTCSLHMLGLLAFGTSRSKTRQHQQQRLPPLACGSVRQASAPPELVWWMASACLRRHLRLRSHHLRLRHLRLRHLRLRSHQLPQAS